MDIWEVLGVEANFDYGCLGGPGHIGYDHGYVGVAGRVLSFGFRGLGLDLKNSAP